MAEDKLQNLLQEIEGQGERLDQLMQQTGGPDGLRRAQRIELGFAPDATVAALYADACREETFDRPV